MHSNEIGEIDKSEEGFSQKANEGQELYSYFNNKKYARYPIKTRLIVFSDDLLSIIKDYALPHYKDGDVFCITSKVVSITRGFYVKESNLKVGWLAKFLVRFVKKWPNDPGFAIPQKIQVAMNESGWLRFSLAVFIGGFLKLLGFSGWFYRIAGHNVNAIDGFVPHLYPEKLRGYGFLAPKNPEKICNEIENETGMPTAILDGNNVENIIVAMGKNLNAMYNKKDLLEILNGNPQGQTGNTPMLLVREIK